MRRKRRYQSLKNGTALRDNPFSRAMTYFGQRFRLVDMGRFVVRHDT